MYGENGPAAMRLRRLPPGHRRLDNDVDVMLTNADFRAELQEALGAEWLAQLPQFRIDE
jgi:hypothetical protein